MPLPNLSKTAKVGIGWCVVVVGGLYSFYISKTIIDKNRYENMKVRERLRKATQEDYTPIRNFQSPEIKEK